MVSVVAATYYGYSYSQLITLIQTVMRKIIKKIRESIEYASIIDIFCLSIFIICALVALWITILSTINCSIHFMNKF